MFSMEWFRLDGQNAFVTGAGSGIGQGIAIGLAQAGSRVSICQPARALMQPSARSTAWDETCCG